MTAVLVAGGLALSACATEEYVDKKVAAVQGNVDALSSKVDSGMAAMGTRIDAVDATAKEGVQKADAANALAMTKSDAKFARADTGQTVSVNFDTGKYDLSQDAQTALTALADKLKADNKDVNLTIIGYADVRGKRHENRELGWLRARQVLGFLYEQGIPASRMTSGSYGESKAADANDRSPETLAKDRRVDVIVTM
jgi:outer membrane protein OmpA-like peptidoglycan-associated protein